MYLGSGHNLVFDAKFKFNAHIKNLNLKAYRLINLFLRAFPKSNALQIKLFRIYIRPIIEYALPAWGPRYLGGARELERIQIYLTRRLCGSSKNGGPKYPERLKALGLESLEQRRMYIDLIHVYKSLFLNNPSPDVLGLELLSDSVTRGHSFKLLRKYVSASIRKSFFY